MLDSCLQPHEHIIQSEIKLTTHAAAPISPGIVNLIGHFDFYTSNLQWRALVFKVTIA